MKLSSTQLSVAAAVDSCRQDLRDLFAVAANDEIDEPQAERLAANVPVVRLFRVVVLRVYPNAFIHCVFSWRF